MTDEAYVFHEDSKEKKRTARSAHKKPAHNSRRCRFPSDYKTRKELNAMNSEVKTYALSQPMKWAEFCAMPEDLQKQYLISLRAKYNANLTCLGEMFGVNRQTVANRFVALNLENPTKETHPYPEWYSFLKHGTPAREFTPIRDLIPEELREKLDRYEAEHPHVKANVERVREENAVDEKSTPEPAAQPAGYVLTADDAIMLSNIHGVLLAISATTDSPALSAMLQILTGEVKRLVKAWKEVQG